MYENLSRLRNYLRKNGFYGIIIPSNDSHFSEYVSPYWNCGEYVSGFEGSASTVVVTLDRIAIWVDSRYYSQAEIQCVGCEIQKIGIRETPTIAQWLSEVSCSGSVIVVDGKLFNLPLYISLKAEIESGGVMLKNTKDFFNEFWEDRGSRPSSKVNIMPVEISGMSVADKLQLVRSGLALSDTRHYLITALDEIAWLLNIRGSDIPFNPVIVSYVVISGSSLRLFIDDNKIGDDVAKYFAREGVEVLAYDCFDKYLKSFVSETVIYDPYKISIFHYELMCNFGVLLCENNIAEGIVTVLKSVKNEVELSGFRRAMIEDGVALVGFYCWLKTELDSGNYLLTEYDLGLKLTEYRAKSKLYIGDSFSPIVAFGSNGAMPHYLAKPEECKVIERADFLLIDSGAHYQCGTTDITRTIHLFNPSKRQKRDYTLVLQGMIDLTNTVFPLGTIGSQLDMIARGNLLCEGLNYGHGTGHGVGHCLNVHEGPNSISPTGGVPYEVGMVTSNEPALYRDWEYGIRIENLIVCEPYMTNEFGCFMRFDTLTLFPIETKSIEVELLTTAQKNWLNSYNKKVCDVLSEYLSLEEKRWLVQQTNQL